MRLISIIIIKYLVNLSYLVYYCIMVEYYFFVILKNIMYYEYLLIWIFVRLRVFK